MPLKVKFLVQALSVIVFRPHFLFNHGISYLFAYARDKAGGKRMHNKTWPGAY